MITEAHVSVLHSCFEKFTGQKLPLRSVCDSRRLAWERFLASGHTQAQLETVLFYLNRKIRDDGWSRGCERFTNLIEDLNHFEEVYAEANATQRNAKPPPSPKAIVQQQWNRTVGEPVTENTRSVGELIAEMRKAVDAR